jgi:ABC-type transporter Mla MlaB component
LGWKDVRVQAQPTREYYGLHWFVGFLGESMQCERGATGEMVVRFTYDDVLDAMTARGLAERYIREVPSGERVAVDLSQAREVDYYGLAALAHEIARTGTRVHLRGLSDRHVRILKYFDVDLAVYGRAQSERG